MKQIVIDADLQEKKVVEITGDDYHHAVRVFRLKKGDRIKLLDINSLTYEAVIKKISKSVMFCHIQGAEENSKALNTQNQDLKGRLPKRKLFLAVTRPKTMELVFRQSVEMGLDEIQLIYSDHSFFKNPEQWNYENKKSRFEKILKEAQQQSGALSRPEIHEGIALQQAMESNPATDGVMTVFFHEKIEIPQVKQIDLFELINEEINEIHFFIGPEGGFSSEEIALFQEKGYIPIYLPANIMRTETAVVFGCSWVTCAWQMTL